MTTTPHGRSRYQRGCRCATCCSANRTYARDRKRAKQSQLRALPPIPADPSPQDQPQEPGPVGAAVRAQLDTTAAARERPGLAAIAVALAEVLDNQSAIPQHAAAAHRLIELLGLMSKSATRHGRLTVVRSMTEQKKP